MPATGHPGLHGHAMAAIRAKQKKGEKSPSHSPQPDGKETRVRAVADRDPDKEVGIVNDADEWVDVWGDEPEACQGKPEVAPKKAAEKLGVDFNESKVEEGLRLMKEWITKFMEWRPSEGKPQKL